MKSIFKKKLFAGIIIAILAGQISLAAKQNGQEKILGEVAVSGNTSIKDSEIIAKARSRVGQQFQISVAEEDCKRIAVMEGVEYCYYNSTVVNGKIKLTFVVVEKNLVRSIRFEGNYTFAAKKLLKKIDVKTGDYFTIIMAEEGRKALYEYYRKKGYAFAAVKLEPAGLAKGQILYNISEGPRVRISAVKLKGNEKIKTKDLKKVVKLKKNKFIFFKRYLNEEHIKKELVRLQNVYYDHGYLDVGIQVNRSFNNEKTKIVITFIINEGNAYVVGNVAIEGVTQKKTEDLKKEMVLEEKQTYNERKAKEDVDTILKAYRTDGFIDVTVDKEQKFISDTTVDVHYKTEEKSRYKIGAINISGNEDTQDKVIRRVLDEYDFSPGKWYNADLARANGQGQLEKLVKRTAVLESVVITPVKKGDDLADAQVTVVEGQTGSIMLGAGIASDSGLMGQIIYEQKNFDIKDKPKSFYEFITGKAYKGAGQNMRIALQPGTDQSTYSISFTEPYLYNKPMSLNFSASIFERGQECYEEQRIRSYFGLEKRYKSKWRRSVSFRAEQVTVGSLDFDAPEAVVDDKGKSTFAGIKLGITRNLTDDAMNPSKGTIVQASFEQVGGDHIFSILSGTYKKFKTLNIDLADRKTILATKLHAAAIIGDAPVYEKFYAGGASSIRGFEYRGVSTRGRPRVGGVNTNGKKKDPIGSNWLFLANAEVTVPLASDNFAMLFFVDAGAIDSGSFRASVGTGVQILIPRWFGPVPMRFELATPLMKSGDDKTQVFSFSVGRLF